MEKELTDLQVANVKLDAAEKAFLLGIIKWAEYLDIVKEFHKVCDAESRKGAQ